MKHKKSVLKILSANSECFRVSAGIAGNYMLHETTQNNNAYNINKIRFDLAGEKCRTL